MSATSIDPARKAKLERQFFQICKGKAELTVDNGAQFLEAIYTHDNAVNCIGLLAPSKKGLEAFKKALSLDLSLSFLNDIAPLLLEFIQHPDLKQVTGGAYLRTLVEHIVHPTIFWVAFTTAFEDGLLQERAQKALVWLFLQVVSLPDGSPSRDVIEEDDILDALLESDYVDVRNLAQQAKKTLSSSTLGNIDQNGPGGRHDNDFADYREISIVPTADELFSTSRPFYRTSAAIENCEKEDTRSADYLDNLFRLLREDMLYEMREEIQIALGKVKGRKHRGVVVENLKLNGLYCGEPNRKSRWSLTFSIEKDIKGMENLNTEKDRKNFFIQNKRILKDRALSVLLADDQLFAFATIQRHEDLLSQSPSIVTLQLQGDAGSLSALSKLKFAKSIKLIQVEVALFAYEPTLKALQSMRSVPLEDELLFWKDTLILRGVPFAPQLAHIVSALRRDPKTDLKPLIRTNTSIVLDRAQGASLISALTQRVSLIQGPPGSFGCFICYFAHILTYLAYLGTGKSFIGALLAKCIHDFTDRTILVVCYTNHALDQFLEDLLKIGIPEASMLRLGGKSTTATEAMNIRNKRPSGKISYASVDGLKAESDVLERSAQAAFSRFKGYAVGDQEVMLHLEFDYPRFWNAFKIPTSDDGMTQVGKGGKAVDEYHLLRRWSEDKDPGTFKRTLGVMQHNDIWMMKPDARKAQRAKWEKEILESEVELLVRPLKDYNLCQDNLKRAFAEKNVAIMKEMRIVACTTTGAAMNFESLRAAPPHVLLVEEAGEILESHVITSLGEGSEQMILIGDHQ